ncbi:tripartite motif-containing protein 34-like isoform X3 [Lontra canadensis]|uniref:tripartite motif-containing protein 34-like isoform X3 n=1 Tax=Lontra canadensis TaxID=76717 RepID=UPI0013F349E6|nr:tripartite motif-containing protein 34-like isoform X3 [Lontra canadensis]
MASKILNIQDEVSCPICLELLTESLTLDCGHSSCQACITVNTTEAEISPGEESSCPMCGVRYSLRNLCPNQPLINMMERIRKFKLNPEEKLKRDLCVHHEEKLLLFCKEDRKVICWVCERSQEHRGHHIFLVEEVVKECQEKLQAALERLRKEQQKAEKLEADIREERISWKDMSGIIKWSEIWTLKKPKTVSKRLTSVFHAPDLSTVLHMRRELTHVQCYWVDITLNPVNLNLNLVLSEDQRQVMSVPIWPVDCTNFGILGSQYFSSGKHYWEIDVSKKCAWILGVYCRTRFHNKKSGVRQGTNHQSAYSRYRPQCGYWVIGLQNEFGYKAFEESSTSQPTVLTISMAVPPHRIGVFLDYDAGIVSFFNVTNHGSLIHKFSKCCFSQTAYPYFNPWNCPGPIILCPPHS